LFSRLTHIGIVNIIAGKKVVPEFLQFDATPKNISRKVIELMRAPEKLRAMKDEFAAIKSSLGPAGSSGRAAKVVLSYLR
jgi:lipid-A-disaccharide synthase